jgi:hypothetical protein
VIGQSEFGEHCAVAFDDRVAHSAAGGASDASINALSGR